MHDVGLELPHDTSQAPEEKLKPNTRLAGYIHSVFKAMRACKIPVETPDATDSMFKAIPAKSLDYFQNPVFCTSNIQPVDHMKQSQSPLPQSRSHASAFHARLTGDGRSRRPAAVR